MDQRHSESADSARSAIERGCHDPTSFRSSLLTVPADERDAWLDRVLGISELADDGPELPAGCVPYLPCPVDVLLRMIDAAAIAESDVFVDIGAGVGRAAAFVHLVTGASAIGLEIQPALALAARQLTSRLLLSRVRCIQGDAAELTQLTTPGSVFLLYCPFGGERLGRVVDHLESIARTRMLRICCVHLQLPARVWLTPGPVVAGDLRIYRSTANGSGPKRHATTTRA